MKQHIYPCEDIKPHEMTESCWCNPTVDEEDDIVIHNSADRREMYEVLPLQ